MNDVVNDATWPRRLTWAELGEKPGSVEGVRQKVVGYVGRDPKGRDVFAVDLMVPASGRPDKDVPATPKLVRLVSKFYRRELSLSTWQAHTLLCHRDYAVAAAARLHPDFSARSLAYLARFIAAFLLSRPDAPFAVTRWIDRQFRTFGPAGPVQEVERFHLFAVVQAFAADVLTDLGEAGAKKFRSKQVHAERPGSDDAEEG